MENEQYIESGLSVGAVKYVDPNEIITEEEYNYIKNKTPELDRRVGVIENEIDEINSSLDNMKNLSDDPILHGAIPNDEVDSCEIFLKLIGDGYVIDLKGNTFKISNTIIAGDLRLKNGTIVGDTSKTLFDVSGNIVLDNITIKNSKNAIYLNNSEIKNRTIIINNCIFFI